MKKKRQPLTQNARALRQRSTEAERRLWRALRARRLEYKFRRQVPLRGYIVDFLCIKQRVVIELDGSQHATPEGRAADAERDANLAEAGFRMLRFWNHEIFEELPVVLERI